MGYTHYWYQSRAFTPVEWSQITAEAKRIIAAASKTVDLRGPDGTGEPAFDNDAIAFNGNADKGQDHETMVIERAPVNPPHRARANDPEVFAFCKTDRKPYDSAVVSLLASVMLIAPNAVKVSSDGGEAAIKMVF